MITILSSKVNEARVMNHETTKKVKNKCEKEKKEEEETHIADQ